MATLHTLPVRRNQASLSTDAATDGTHTMNDTSATEARLPLESLPPIFRLSDSKAHRYEKLVQHYHGDIYRYGYWLCKNADIAQDLVQETFLRAWKSLDSLLDPAAAKAWLVTILRRENARRFERKQFDYDDNTEQDSLSDDSDISAEQHYDNTLLRRKMAALAPEYREPLVLQVIAGFNSDEIAKLLQLNVNTVNTRLFRARKLLRDSLTQQGDSHLE